MADNKTRAVYICYAVGSGFLLFSTVVNGIRGWCHMITAFGLNDKPCSSMAPFAEGPAGKISESFTGIFFIGLPLVFAKSVLIPGIRQWANRNDHHTPPDYMSLTERERAQHTAAQAQEQERQAARPSIAQLILQFLILVFLESVGAFYLTAASCPESNKSRRCTFGYRRDITQPSLDFAIPPVLGLVLCFFAGSYGIKSCRNGMNRCLKVNDPNENAGDLEQQRAEYGATGTGTGTGTGTDTGATPHPMPPAM